jgi:hypothetical protein
MKRMTILSAAAVATFAAAVPAFAGIAGNPSFSHKLPVRAPANAQVATFDDHGGATTRHLTGNSSAAVGATPTASSVPSVSPSEPGDDRGGRWPSRRCGCRGCSLNSS